MKHFDQILDALNTMRGTIQNNIESIGLIGSTIHNQGKELRKTQADLADLEKRLVAAGVIKEKK